MMTVVLLFVFPIVFQRLGAGMSQKYSARAILERAMFLGRKIL
jgi:hypothetical protein